MARIDPNKYSKNADIRPESKLSLLLAVIRIILIGFGLIGISVALFREDGWLSKLMSKVFESTATMLLIPVIIFAIWLLNRWLSTPNKSETKKNGDIPMHVMIVIGVYYIYKIFTTGSF